MTEDPDQTGRPYDVPASRWLLGGLTICLFAGILSVAWSLAGVSGAVLGVIACTAVILAARIAQALGGGPTGDDGRARAVLDVLATAVVIMDHNGKIDGVNPAAERLFGYAPGTLVGRNVATLLPKDVTATLTDKTLGFAEIAARVNGNRALDGLPQAGRDVPIEVHVSAVRFGRQRRIVGVITDVSARKAEEERRSRLIRDLERANGELDKFAYVASHDLKAPLRGIDNASQWLAEDLAPHLTDDTRESLNMLRGRVQRMERLLNALLEHSRIGRIASDPEIVRGEEIAAEVLESVRKPDAFALAFDARFLNAQLPRAPLSGVVGHLVDNAIRHHDRAEGHITVSLKTDEDFVTIRVKDDGPGIADDYHQKVFEIFQTLTRRDERDSCGMGLAIVQKHADVCGGRISIEPSDGRGTTMRLDWPITTENATKTEQVA